MELVDQVMMKTVIVIGQKYCTIPSYTFYTIFSFFLCHRYLYNTRSFVTYQVYISRSFWHKGSIKMAGTGRFTSRIPESCQVILCIHIFGGGMNSIKHKQATQWRCKTWNATQAIYTKAFCKNSGALRVKIDEDVARWPPASVSTYPP